MNPIAVLYLNPTAQLGGAEHSLLDLVGHLNRDRFAPRIACLGDGPLLPAAGARGIAVEALAAPEAFVRTSLRGKRTGIARVVAGVVQALPTAWRIRRLAHAGGATILHSNGNKTHLLAAIARLGSAIRVVWHVRDFLPDRPLERWVVRLANRAADAVIANSNAVATHLWGLGARSDLVHAIPSGIDCVRFSPFGPSASLRRQFGWPDDCRIVGMIGIFARWKGQSVFLEAAKEILQKRHDVRFVLVGKEIYLTDGHGGFKQELVRLTRELGIDDAVAFAGYRDDVPEVIRALDVVVHASVEPEPFGRVVAEAMACARPVVATDGGGVPEITGPSGRAALLVPRGDVSCLASAVIALLDEPDRGQALGDAGRARIVEQFEIGRHVRLVEALYERLLGHSRLRILHAGKFYPPARGGMETVVGQLCADTVGDWKVQAVVANDCAQTTRESRGGVQIVRAAAVGRVASVSLCPTLPLHLWNGRHDCVILHEPNPLAAAALLLWTPAPRLVIWHHSDLVYPWWGLRVYGWLQRALYRRADCVIVSSFCLADHSPVIRYARRVEVIPYGIAVEHFLEPNSSQRARAEAIRARYPGPLVLFVGRLVYYKGVGILLKAMTKCPGTLLIVGDGPAKESLRELAGRLGMAARVEFMGEAPTVDLSAYYHAADVFVLPSTERTEAFGIVQVEAMACGVPVVSTDLPTGVPWVNQDGVTGLVVPPGDPDALAGAIGLLLEDPVLRARMAEAGRRRATKEFSRERMLRDFKSLVERVVGEQALL